MNKSVLHWVLKLESLLILVGSLFVAYSCQTSLSYLSWIVLLMWPDLSLLGYLIGPKIGSILYNTAHSYVLPFSMPLLFLIGTFFGWRLPVPALGLVFVALWVAHIAMDRTLGFGLKYETNFWDTHLDRV